MDWKNMLQTALNPEMTLVHTLCAAFAIVAFVFISIFLILGMRSLHKNPFFVKPDKPNLVKEQ